MAALGLTGLGKEGESVCFMETRLWPKSPTTRGLKQHGVSNPNF